MATLSPVTMQFVALHVTCICVCTELLSQIPGDVNHVHLLDNKQPSIVGGGLFRKCRCKVIFW